MLDQTTVRSLFTYEPTKGHLFRKSSVTHKPIKSPQVVINGVYYRTTTVIWLYMTGETPQYIHRINKKNSDNRWVNFRLPRTNTPNPSDNLNTLNPYNAQDLDYMDILIGELLASEE
jgi:hypothetical protein